MSPCSRAKRTAFILLLTHPFVVEAAAPAGTCVADDETRCLGDSRFAVEMDWRTGDGRSGAAKVVREGTNDSGLFYFF